MNLKMPRTRKQYCRGSITLTWSKRSPRRGHQSIILEPEKSGGRIFTTFFTCVGIFRGVPADRETPYLSVSSFGCGHFDAHIMLSIRISRCAYAYVHPWDVVVTLPMLPAVVLVPFFARQVRENYHKKKSVPHELILHVNINSSTSKYAIWGFSILKPKGVVFLT